MYYEILYQNILHQQNLMVFIITFLIIHNSISDK